MRRSSDSHSQGTENFTHDRHPGRPARLQSENMRALHGYRIHITHLQRATGISDWIALMQRQDRLPLLLKAADPIDIGALHLLDGGPYTWSELLCNIVGIGSDIWGLPTDLELAGRSELADIVFEWLGMGCWSEPDGEIATELKRRIHLLAEKLNQ